MKLDLRGIGRNKRSAEGPLEGARLAEQAAPVAAPAQHAAPVQNTASTVNDAVNQYANKSEAELMGELLNFKKQGVIDDEKLAEVYTRLAPLLNEQQRKRLESVLGTLKNT